MTALVVTGWGVATAAGEGAVDTPVWDALEGVRVARAVLPLRAWWPGAPERIGRMDRPAAHALLVAQRAFERAGLVGSIPSDMAVLLGTSLGCAEVNERYHRGLVERGGEGASPLLFAQTIPSTSAGEVAIAFGARGHTSTVMAGRASGVAALVEARRALALGRASIALVLAIDTVGADRLRLRASRGEAPCAEAAVALVLEPAPSAIAAGRAPLATLDEARLTSELAAPATEQVDWLGASGLVELVAWIDHGHARSFEAHVGDPSGQVGVLRASRPSATST